MIREVADWEHSLEVLRSRRLGEARFSSTEPISSARVPHRQRTNGEGQMTSNDDDVLVCAHAMAKARLKAEGEADPVRARALLLSGRGQFLLSRALHLAVIALDAKTGSERAPSDRADMSLMLRGCFPEFAIQHASTDAYAQLSAAARKDLEQGCCQSSISRRRRTGK